jgi:hypothetical protein
MSKSTDNQINYEQKKVFKMVKCTSDRFFFFANLSSTGARTVKLFMVVNNSVT